VTEVGSKSSPSQHIVFVEPNADEILFRTLPHDRKRSGDIGFDTKECEALYRWMVVHDDSHREIPSNIPRSRRILFLAEPPDVKYYHPKFVSQFGIVTGPCNIFSSGGSVVLSQPAIPWFYGIDFNKSQPVLSFDDLVNLKPSPNKVDAVSVVISKKTRTREHRSRLRLVEHLAKHLGDKLHIFGRDFTPIADKREAIDGYKYHLSLENNVMPHFWTEKLADPWLGWALPFYAGCPNLSDYFPDGSYIRIFHDDPQRSAALITEAMASGAYERALPAIEAARTCVLHEHSLPAVVARIITTCAPNARGPVLREPETIYPNIHFRWRKKLSRRIRSFILGLRK
jgi:hypothetical protein